MRKYGMYLRSQDIIFPMKSHAWVLKTFITYSLISIKQNYNFDMLAISQDLKSFAAQEHGIVFVLTVSCA